MRKLNYFRKAVIGTCVAGALMGHLGCRKNPRENILDEKSQEELISRVEEGIDSLNSLDDVISYASPAQFVSDIFPPAEFINGVGKIDRYEVEKPNRLLIHMRQKHFSYPLRNMENYTGDIKEFFRGLYDKQFREVNNVQKDIFESLMFLKNAYGMTNVRGEGVNSETTRENLKLNMSIRYDLMIREGFIDPENQDSVKEYGFVVGGYETLVKLGKLDLLPSENKEIYEKALRIRKVGGFNSDEFKIIQEQRENELLKIISKSDSSYSIVVYGGNHDFRNNINEWNIKNPENKFSLIELTP